jgi:uncharacterized Zn-finger protein
MNDITCPYCEAVFECDDYYEYDDSELFEQECPKCEKIILVEYEIWPSFDTFKAPCKNGEEHLLIDIHGSPIEYYKYRKRCKYCQEEFVIDEIKNKQELKKYFNSLEIK